jgi:parvulin-like peptidyl-prolyl isomerase
MTMLMRYLVLCLLVAMALAISCGKSEEKAVARVGDEIITVAALKGDYLAISKEARPILTTIEQKEQFARDVVSKEILVREGRKIGLDRMPEIVEAMQGEIQRSAWQAYYDDNVRSQVEVTDEDLRALYAKQRYRYDLAWIFLRSAGLAQQIADRIAAGEDFARLALVYSLDASRAQGGDIGARALGTMPDNIEDEVMMMEPGEVRGPLAYDSYYILVKLHGKEPVEQLEFEAARTGLSSLERMRRENRRHRDLAAQVRAKYELAFNDDVLDLIASRTRALYPTEDAESGQIPQFSDEESARKVATYKGGEWQVRTYVDRLKTQRGFIAPGPGTDPETIKSVIKDFITGDLWMMEIQAGGYEQRPDIVSRARRKQEEMIVTAMHNSVVKDVTIDDEKLREVYEENREEMVTDPTVRLAVIAVETAEEAEAIHRELGAGGSFADLAREKSIDKMTAENGGEIPRPLPKTQLEQFPELDELVDRLGVGSYSTAMPIPPGFGPAGYMVVKVLAKTASRPMTFGEVRDSLEERMLQVEQDRAFGQWLRDRMEEYEVEIYPDALGGIDFSDLKEREA